MQLHLLHSENILLTAGNIACYQSPGIQWICNAHTDTKRRVKIHITYILMLLCVFITVLVCHVCSAIVLSHCISCICIYCYLMIHEVQIINSSVCQ